VKNLFSIESGTHEWDQMLGTGKTLGSEVVTWEDDLAAIFFFVICLFVCLGFCQILFGNGISFDSIG
jgi:hypothetical protein